MAHKALKVNQALPVSLGNQGHRVLLVALETQDYQGLRVRKVRSCHINTCVEMFPW